MRNAIVIGSQSLYTAAIAALLVTSGYNVHLQTQDAVKAVEGMKECDAELVVINGHNALDLRGFGMLAGAVHFADCVVVGISDSPKGPKEIEWMDPNTDAGDFLDRVQMKIDALGRQERRKDTGRRRYGSYKLTKREFDVAMLVARGLSNRNIAESLSLQEQSVKNLVSVIMRKLVCENRVQVALKLRGEAGAADVQESA